MDTGDEDTETSNEPADVDDFDAVAQAAIDTAAADTAMEPTIVTDAVRYAHDEQGTGQSQYRSLLLDVAGDRSDTEAPPTDRQRAAYARLRDHVERRRSREADVDGLFE